MTTSAVLTSHIWTCWLLSLEYISRQKSPLTSSPASTLPQASFSSPPGQHSSSQLCPVSPLVLLSVTQQQLKVVSQIGSLQEAKAKAYTYWEVQAKQGSQHKACLSEVPCGSLELEFPTGANWEMLRTCLPLSDAKGRAMSRPFYPILTPHWLRMNWLSTSSRDFKSLPCPKLRVYPSSVIFCLKTQR